MQRTIRRALLSVSDKSGLIELARVLVDFKVELISTGGTRKALADAGLPVKDISDVTGFPEILDGRVKTLHPKVHGGLLFIRDNAEHQKTAKEQGIEPIDLVVCNLYPFEATVAKGASHEDTVENIDIGGPSMVRSAAKNYHDVAIVTDPAQYAWLIEELKSSAGALSLPTREKLAAAAFQRHGLLRRRHCAYFAGRQGDAFPARLALPFQLRMPLRYGENPHQHAAFYVEGHTPWPCVANAEVLHGKELSYNNLLDIDSALNLVREFSPAGGRRHQAQQSVRGSRGRHTRGRLQEGLRGRSAQRVGSDPGVQSRGRRGHGPADQPSRTASSSASSPPATRRPPSSCSRIGPSGRGACIAQYRCARQGPGTRSRSGLSPRRRRPARADRDVPADDFASMKVASQRSPSDAELADLKFAWLVCKHVKSNAIVLAKEGMIVGVGAGQMSRVDSVQIAVRKAGDRSRGAVLASDAFFPFRDGVDAAAAAGVKAVVQPGGSKNDAESIAACNEQGLAMVLTGVRHFRH